MNVPTPPRPLPSPSEMVAHLDRYVHGQGQAKRDLATAVYNHYVGLAARDRGGEGTALVAGPQHVLLIGPTGTGKSYLVKTLAKHLGVPFSFVSCTSLSKTGYVGLPVEHVIHVLYDRAERDVHRAERGIVFLDEFDKVRAQPAATGPDVSGEGVQIGLLTLLDGRPVPTEQGGGMASSTTIDTSRVLFVLAGAFVGLEDIIHRRVGHETAIGFRKPKTEPTPSLAERAQVEDLIQFGFIPELIGRVGTLSACEPLSPSDLREILTNTEESALRRKTEFWNLHGIRLEFTPEALDAIAQRAFSLGTGARALNRILEGCLDDVDWRPVELMEEGVRRIVVSAETVRGEAPPTLHKGSEPVDVAALPITELRAQAFRPVQPAGAITKDSVIQVSDSRRMSAEEISARYTRIRDEILGWPTASASARAWWAEFEKAYQQRPGMILRLTEELAVRKATIDEFLQSYMRSNTENIQANLHYFDYLRLKKAEADKQSAKKPPGSPPTSPA